MMRVRPTPNHTRRDDDIWPAGNDQARVAMNKPGTVPHFLCRAQHASDPDYHGDRLHAEEPEMATTQEHSFAPISPHVHRMMARRTEQPKHQPPPWALDTQAEDRRPVLKGLAVASCLVLASAIGLTVTALEFKGAQSDLPTAWNSSLAAIWPSFSAPPQDLRRLPIIGRPLPETEKPAAKPQVKLLTKIASVKLTVSDTNGAAQVPIPLSLKAEAGDSEPPIAIRLTGLPAEARLSAGSKLDDTAWLINTAELANLHMTMPRVPAAPVKVTVAAIEVETGELAAPMQEMVITVDPKSLAVQPAALPVTNSRSDSSEVASKANYATSKAALAMRKRGDETLALGDVAGARGFYTKALQMGDTVAAARIGRTYDPVIFQAVGVHGLKPDPKMAERWYLHAIKEGDTNAHEDLDRLNKRLSP